MEFQKAFEESTSLISQYGKNKAFIIWGMGLYLDDPDLQTLADESLTDNGDDHSPFDCFFDGIHFISTGNPVGGQFCDGRGSNT